jgi:hypothetical protein
MQESIIFKNNCSYNFQKDIVLGEEGEVFIKNFLISKDFKFISENKDEKFDLLMSYNGRLIKYEIKTDVLLSKEKDTGNLVIEFESRGKPSGISVTQADYFVYFIPKLKEIWNIKVENLKNIINNNKLKKVSGGDLESNTKMYLMNRNKFRKNFKIHKIY